MTMLQYLVIGMILTILVLFACVIRDTVRRKGRWGINLETPKCPNCRASLDFVRNPATFRESIWGGWTCRKCQTKVDKWGNQIDF